MMYELTCPACGHKVKLPFVRVGAMVSCRGCSHRFQVQLEHINRLVQIPADTGLDSDNVLLLGLPPEKPPPPARAIPRVKAQSEPPSGNGASTGPVADMIEPPRPEDSLRPIVPVLKHEAPSEDVAKVIARHRAQRGRGRRLVWLAAIGVVMLLATVVVVFVIARRTDDQTGRGTTGASRGGAVTGDGKSHPPESSAVDAIELATSGWKEVDEPLDSDIPTGPVILVDGRLAPGSSGHKTYLAGLEVLTDQLIEQATLHLMLLDKESGLVFARNKIPLMLLSTDEADNDRRHPVTVSIPLKLADRTEDVFSWVQVGPTDVMEEGHMLRKIAVNPSSTDVETKLKITATNPLDTAMRRAVFLIRAFNRQHETVGRWRVDWPNTIDPGKRLNFVARVQSQHTSEIDVWEVVAAGTIMP